MGAKQQTVRGVPPLFPRISCPVDAATYAKGKGDMQIRSK